MTITDTGSNVPAEMDPGVRHDLLVVTVLYNDTILDTVMRDATLRDVAAVEAEHPEAIPHSTPHVPILQEAIEFRSSTKLRDETGEGVPMPDFNLKPYLEGILRAVALTQQCKREREELEAKAAAHDPDALETLAVITAPDDPAPPPIRGIRRR